MTYVSIGFKSFMVGLFGLVFATSVMAEGQAPDNIPGTTKVSAEDIIDLFDTHDNLVIIDARKTSDRDPGYIPGSIGLPNYETTPAKLKEYIPTLETPVVFYCNGVKCGRSVESAKMALKEGYKNIYWFRGGWDEWSEKGLPVEK